MLRICFGLNLELSEWDSSFSSSILDLYNFLGRILIHEIWLLVLFLDMYLDQNPDQADEYILLGTVTYSLLVIQH